MGKLMRHDAGKFGFVQRQGADLTGRTYSVTLEATDFPQDELL